MLEANISEITSASRWLHLPYTVDRSGRFLPIIWPTSDVPATPTPSANVNDRLKNCAQI